MPKPDYTILLVDDDNIYSQTLVESAFDDFAIGIVHYEDWENAYTQLKGNPDKFQAIILDAKGKLTQDDSSESMSHIINALQDLKKLEGHELFFPYVINTGYFDDSVMEHLRGVKIFAKGNEEEMFRYLIDQIKCSPANRIRKKYENIFSLFDDSKLPSQMGLKLQEVLIFAESSSWQKAPDDFFNPVRKILESVFWKLKELKLIDERCFPKNEINLKGCINFLSGNTVKIGLIQFTGPRIIPDHINYSMTYLYETTSTFSHQYLKDNEVSPYALQSVVLALCEVLFWFREFLVHQNKNLTTK